MTLLVQLHLHLFAAIDTLWNGNPQSGAGDIENGSVDRLGWAGQEFELGGILGGVANFGRGARPASLRPEAERSRRDGPKAARFELVWQRKPTFTSEILH